MLNYLFKDGIQEGVKLIMLVREIGIKAGEVDPKEVDEFIASCGTEYMSKYRTVPLSDLTKEFLMGAKANEEKMKEKLL